MIPIYIHDRKGYLKKKINDFICTNSIDLDIVFYDEKKDFLVLDSTDFFFVINDIDDFFYYVNEYRFFDDFKIIIMDFRIKNELKKCKIRYFTFLTFCDYLKF